MIPSAAAVGAPSADVYGVFSRSYETDNVSSGIISFGSSPLNAFSDNLIHNFVSDLLFI